MFSEVCSWFYRRSWRSKMPLSPRRRAELWMRCVISEQEWTQVPEVSVLVGVIE